MEAENKLGKVESEHLIQESAWFGEFVSLFSSPSTGTRFPTVPRKVRDWCLDVDGHVEYLFVCVAVKTDPPSNVSAISEDGFPTSLLINWTHPVPEDYLRLIYEIRFCTRGASNWNYVSLFLG